MKMEVLLKYIMKNVSNSDLEHLMLQWGCVHLENIELTSKRSDSANSIIRHFKKNEVFFHDVAELDLLRTIKFPGKLTWEAHKLKFDDDASGTPPNITDYDTFEKLYSDALNKFVYCDLVVTEHKTHFWCRISKPESTNSVYMIYYPNSCYFLLAKTPSNLKHIVCSALCSCLGAEHSALMPLDGRNPDSIWQILLQTFKNTNHDVRSYLHKKNQEELCKMHNVINESLKRKCDKFDANEKAFGSHILPVVDHLTVETHTSCKARKGLPELEDGLIIHGRLEFTGPNVLEGLKELVNENLADVPTPNYLTSVPKLGRNYLHIQDK